LTREQLEQALREAEVPDEPAARERVRRTVLAAHRQRAPQRRPRGTVVWVAVAALCCALVVTQRDSRPARAMEKIFHQVVAKPKAAPPRAASGLALPARGRLLVSEGDAVYVVDRAGKRTRLGRWQDATWSPQGLFAAVTSGHTLAAVEPGDGAVRWRLARPDPVSLPRWAPGGRHIAYRSGDTLRIVYGNGLHDVLAGEHMAAVAPAWRPGDDHTVAWAATGGTVTVEDADTAKVLFTHTGARVRQLAWSGDGRRLLIAGARSGGYYDVATGRRTPLRKPVVAVASGSRLALAVRSGANTEVMIDGETVLSAPGRLRDLQWSPDGRWLLAGWPGADHWLLVRAGARAVLAVRHRFGPAARVRGWCC
jgi:hypothetical protein